MLEGLDQVDWKNLEHAYGPATDTPGHIRDLISPMASRRAAALDALQFSINHQGQVYDATVPSVPFLAEVALDPSSSNRVEILEMLAEIAIGQGWFMNHQSLSFVRQVYPAAVIERNTEQESRVVADLKLEMSRLVHDIIALLPSDDARIRMAATHLVSRLPNAESFACPALVSRLAIETDDSICANTLRCIAVLDRHAGRTAAELMSRDRSKPLTAILALALLVADEKQEAVSDIAPALCERILTDSVETINSYCRLPSGNDYFTDLATTLAMRDSEFAEAVSQRIVRIERQSKYSRYISDSRARSLLIFASFPGGVRTPIAEFRQWQKDAVWLIARVAFPESRTFGYHISLLAQFELPVDPRSLASLLGYSIKDFGWKPWWKFW